MWGFARSRALKTDWHSWEGGIIEHWNAVICQSCWETGTSNEKQSARETVKEIGRDCECKREMGGWALLAHKISFSPHSPFFICSTEEEQDCEEKKKRERRTRTPNLYCSYSRAAKLCFVEGCERICKLDNGHEDTSSKRKGEKKKGMKENCGQLLIHSTVWHGIEKTAQSNRTISFLCWFPVLVLSFCLSHVWYLFFRPRGGR